MVPVKTVMSKKILKVHKGTTVRKVAELMSEKRVGSVFILDGEAFVGIITDTDVTQRVVAARLDPDTTAVEAVMTSPLLAVESTRSIAEANDIMDQEHIRHLAVIEKDKIVGVISARDLLRHVYGGWGLV
jgi:CBS domain-containing protein